MSASHRTGRKVVATAGTRERLSSVENPGPFVIIQALGGNVGTVVFGDEFVVAAALTRQGIALSPGESIGITCWDLRDIWLDATVNGDGVTWLTKNV